MTDKSYDEYVDRAVRDLSTYPVTFREARKSPLRDTVWDEPYIDFSVRELRQLLTDAWLAGLAYSLDLIQEEKQSREPVLWEHCR
jgi:hypothetical protein